MGAAVSSGTYATEMMAAGNFANAGSGLALAISNAGAADAQGKFEKQQYEFNSKVADLQADDAKKRGDKAAQGTLREGRRLKGTQRAMYAAQGIDPNSGTAAEIQDQTDYFAELDATTIRSNAAREAFGYKVQATDLRGRGQFAGIAGSMNANTSLLTGGLQALGQLTQAGSYLAKGRK